MSARSRIIVASNVKRERVAWLWPGRVPLGSLTLLVGDPGLGKSTLGLELSARLSRGELPGGPAWAIVATAEDHLATTVRPRLEAAQADLERVGFVVVDEVEDTLRLPDDVTELEAAVEEVQAKLVVVDPIMAHLSGTVDAWKDQHVRGAIAPLHRLAERQGCAVVAIAHLTKGHSADPMRRTGGSIGLPAAARSALLLARDPDDEEGDRGSRRVLAHWKCNVAPLASSLAYEIRPVLIPARGDEPEVETSRIVELGESDYGGRDLLGPSVDDEGERGAQADAEAFLRGELADGPADVRAIRRLASAAGISPRTLDRAKASVGVVSERVGGIAGDGRWQWSLPKNATLRTPSENSGVGALSEKPHEHTESASSDEAENAYDDHARTLALLGNGPLSHEGRKALKKAVSDRRHEELARNDAEKRERDVKEFQTELDLGTARFGDIRRAHEEGRL